jgi:hypothetical protein
MKRALMTAGGLLVLWAGSAVAQVGAPPQEAKYFRIPHKFQVFVELAGALPTSPGTFNDYWNSAFQFGLGGGMSVFPWLEVNGTFTYASWDNNSTQSKARIGYVGVEDVEGGLISTMTLCGAARFLAVPNSRTNPFAEMTIGYYKTSADDLTIEDVLVNSMYSVGGMLVAPAIGIQYALADSWSTYAKYSYVFCLGGEFAPSDLLLPPGGGERSSGDNQIYQTIGVGIMLRF